MRRAALLLATTMMAARVSTARAQEVAPPRRPAPVPQLSVSLPAEPGRGPALVRAAGTLDGIFAAALHDGFPVRLSYRLELWRASFLFDRLEREVDWFALTQLDPLSGVYTLTRSDGSQIQLSSADSVRAALETPFSVELPPRGASGNNRYYYVGTLEIESLSLSEFEEVERWLRGDLGRAITREGDVGGALERGARRLLIRFSGLPRRRLEARSGVFRF